MTFPPRPADHQHPPGDEDMMSTPGPWDSALTMVGGVARVFGSTARGLLLDGLAAGATIAERAGAALTGGTPALATLPVRVVILSDEKGRPLLPPEAVAGALRRADRVFTEEAWVRVRVAGVHTVAEPAPTEVLDPRANRALLWDDIMGRTAFLRQAVPPRPPLSTGGDPVTVVIVRNIRGNVTGCSLGTTADWVICQASLFDEKSDRSYDETVLAHELGHALNLPHHRDPANLMFSTSSPPKKVRGTRLARWQAAVVVGNRHVIPPA